MLPRLLLRARREQNEPCEVAVENRQVSNLPAVESRSHISTVGLQELAFASRDRDRFGDLSGFECDIRLGLSVKVDSNSRQ